MDIYSAQQNITCLNIFRRSIRPATGLVDQGIVIAPSQHVQVLLQAGVPPSISERSI
jgi:hypothetical protein